MELVEGSTLADRVAHGPLPLDECLAIARQIAEALAAAHEAGVIHRDVKPANVKVRDDGTVKVFGMIRRPLMPGAVRNNQLVLPLSSADSWDWHAGVVDLQTGKVERLAPDYPTDFHFLTRAPDGTPIAAGLGFRSTLWKFTPTPAATKN